MPRLLESVRVVLAIIAGLLMLDTPDSVRFSLSLGVMAFSLYAGGLLWLATKHVRQPASRLLLWLDAGWFLALMALAGPAGLHYFLFLFFPVLFAAWRDGLWESTAVAVLGSLGAVCVLWAPDVAWDRLLAPPVALLVTGPLVARMARAEASLQQGFAFAAALAEQLDPHRQFEAVMPILVERVAREFGATGALLAIHGADGDCRVLCWESGDGCTQLSDAAALPLLDQLSELAPGLAFAFRQSVHWYAREYLDLLSDNGAPAETVAASRACIAKLAGLVGQPWLMSVPMLGHGVDFMRLVLTGQPPGLRTRDLVVLANVVEQLGPTVENSVLLARLATEAVETERARIGRNLHDSAIQPYIGLKFAIEAIVRRAETGNPLLEDLQHLQDIASEELTAMRDVVSGLRGAPDAGGRLLADAVHRQARRFSQLFGVDVDVDIDGALPVDRRLAGELFHVVAEGLSNIRRHTQSRRASITLACQNSLLTLLICNEHGDGAKPQAFTPRSLSERVAALGGRSQVKIDADMTTVEVTIPLD